MGKTKDISEQRFGNLVATLPTKTRKHTQVVWECLCDCGNTAYVKTCNLTSGNTKSCGCLKTGTSGLASSKQVYRSYKDGAKKRGYEFKLSFENFQNLTQQFCFYCGSSPTNVYQSKNCNGSFVYNGIDRVDNNIGYELSNCVACCSQCNYAKRNQTTQQFQSWISRITVFQNDKNKT